MSETISIVYVGEKPKKKDTVCNTRLVFNRFEPVPVAVELANRFLDFPTVWIKEEGLDAFKEKLAKEAELAIKKRIAAEEAAKREAADANMIVFVDGEAIDLGKYNSKQLETFAVAHDLDFEGSKSDMVGFRKSIRNAYRATYQSENELDEEAQAKKDAEAAEAAKAAEKAKAIAAAEKAKEAEAAAAEAAKAAEAAQAAELAKAEEEAEAAKAAQAATDMILIVDGENVDISKYTANQLKAFVAAHDLIVEGDVKPVDTYRVKVRDAYIASTDKAEGGE